MAKRRRNPQKEPAESPAPQPSSTPTETAAGAALDRSRLLWAAAAVAVAAGLALWSWSGKQSAAEQPTAQTGPLIAGQPGYVDGATCAGCHAEIAATYEQTGMGRAFYRASAENMAHLGGDVEFTHEKSNRRYAIQARDGKYFQKRWQIGPDGSEINVLEREIHYVMGSGNHARTYLHQYPDGRLVELPLGWYAHKGGFAAMNPGYDQPVHRGFRREISFDCMFCHNGYPRIEPSADQPGHDALFPGRLVEGIDCQRCHGPGLKHVEAAGAGKADADIRAAIFNPVDETPQRQLEVCLQCHFESTSRKLPYAIVRFDRPAFSYQPQEPLADFVLHFDHPEGVREDKFEIAGHGYRLMQSECFRQSEGMTCTTCHDPHEAKRGAEAKTAYNAVCRDCHQQPLGGAEHAAYAQADCTGCHMPERRTEDVVHVVMTDHKIERRAAPASQRLAPLDEVLEDAKTVYQGEVALDYPATLPSTPENELMLATAQVYEESNLEAGLPRLQALIEKHQPEAASYYFQLAEAYWNQGRYEDSLPWYEQALLRQRDHIVAARNYAVALNRTGDPELAARVLREALEFSPGDAKALTNLGESLMLLGKPAESKRALEQAIQANPDSPEAWSNLSRTLAASGEPERAIEAARNALRCDPAFTTAQSNLGNLLLSAGRLDEAERLFREAIARDPNYAEAHYNYAALLIETGRMDAAEKELRASIRANPRLVAAHTNLGNVLGQKGDARGAEQSFRRALELEPSYAEAHFNLGVALASQNRLGDAKNSFQKALEMDSKLHQARLNLAIALASEGDREQARIELERVIRSADGPIRDAAERTMDGLGLR